MQQHFSRVMTYVNEEWDDTWRSVTDWSELRLTPDELKSLNAELTAVMARHTPSPDTEPAPGALPVVVQLQPFPRKGA